MHRLFQLIERVRPWIVLPVGLDAVLPHLVVIEIPDGLGYFGLRTYPLARHALHHAFTVILVPTVQAPAIGVATRSEL